MIWAHLQLAPLFLFFAVLGLMLVITERRRLRLVERLLGGPAWRRMIPDLNLAIRYGRHALLMLGLIFLGLAALRPQWGYELREVHRRGLDLMVLVDVSQSMQATDLKPSRMMRARMKLIDLSRVLVGDRVGLIPFAGTSYVACPLTTDYEAFALFIEQLDTDLISYQGTDIPGALRLALKSFDAAPERSKAVILMTDGESTTGDLGALADEIKSRGIRVYVIGMGTREGAPVPDEEGEGFKKDARGEVVISRLNEKALKDLAVATGGVYVNSVVGNEDLNQIYLRGIKQEIEQQDLAQGKKRVPEERFEIPLSIGLALVLLASLMREGKKT